MIGTINIKVNAAHPNMPLAPLYAFIGSPSQVRVIDVPKQIGNWKITAVQITANYPDNSAQSVECVLDGGCWHGTLPASTAVGQSLVGFKVTASGVKEDGTTAVTGYVLGAGDVFILNTDSTITVGSTTYYVHLVDSVPATPKKGDLAVIDGVWKIYTGSAWSALGSSTTVAWNDITGKPSWIGNEKPTYTAAEVGADEAGAAATAKSEAIAACDTAGSAAAAKAEAIAACDPSGAADSAVATHNSPQNLDAHKSLFNSKLSIRGGTMAGALSMGSFSLAAPAISTTTIKSTSQANVKHEFTSTGHDFYGHLGSKSTLSPDGSAVLTKTLGDGYYDGNGAAASAVAGDVTHAKSISADGVSTPCTPDSNGNVNVSTLFSSENTSTDPQPSGLLKNSALDIGIVKVTNSIVGVPNATLEAALGTAAS